MLLSRLSISSTRRKEEVRPTHPPTHPYSLSTSLVRPPTHLPTYSSMCSLTLLPYLIHPPTSSLYTVRRTVRAQELWFAILDSQIETGT